MPLKIIYTSAPRLLQAGRSGLGTVAMSRDIPREVIKAAENFSQFSRQPGMEKARVVYSYRTVRCGDGIRHVLSCVRDAGADYSGRTNHLAEHLIFDDREAHDCAAKGHTPAGVLLGTEWRSHDGYCGWIDSPVLWGSADPPATWKWWNFYSGSTECRYNLCTHSALRGAVFAYGKGLEKQTDEEARQVLCLFSESQQECANRGWGITFTTNVEPNDELSDFRWIGVPESSPMLSKLESVGAREWVTLETPPPVRPVATFAHGAGTRTAPKEAIQVPSRPAAPAQASGVGQAASVGSALPPLLSGKTTASKEPFFAKLRGGHLAWAVLGLLVLLSAFLLSRSLFAAPEVQFDKDSLKVTYNGGPQAARIRSAPPQATVAYAKSGTGSWEPTPPTDAGSYKLRLEVPGWFGTRFGSKVISRKEELVIEKARPAIRFPDKLDFDYDGGEHIIEPIIAGPSEPANEAKVVYRGKGRGAEWTASPQKEDGEYVVKVSIAESDNFLGITKETTFRIKKRVGSSSAVTSSAKVDAPELDGTKVASAAGVPPQETQARVVLLPKRDSLKYLAELPDLPAVDSMEVEFRKTAGSPKWEKLGVKWGEPTDGLPSVKPRAYLQEALEYQVIDAGRTLLRVLELEDGAGTAIRKIFETGPFYLERTAPGANSIRLAPQEVFGSNLEILPANAFFEVSFETKHFSVPVLEFRKSASGWEADLPTQKVTGDWEEAEKKLLPVPQEAAVNPVEAFYIEVRDWAARNIKDQPHEAATKLLDLKPDFARLGQNPTSTEVIKAVILDIAKELEPFVPLSGKETATKENEKGQGAGDEALKNVKTHLLSATELRGRLDAKTSDNQLWVVAGEWVNGRAKSVASKDQNKALKTFLGGLGNGFLGSVPQMSATAPTSTVSTEDREAAKRLRRTVNFLKLLGDTSQRPDGQLTFVYSDSGQTQRIGLGSIENQPRNNQSASP